MKIITKYFAFAFLTLFIINTSIAQTLSIGPLLGVNISTVSNSPAAENIAGISAGGFLNYSVNEHVGLNAKVLFTQLGTGYENSTLINRFNYLHVPVSAVYFFGESGNRIRPKVYAGIYAASLTNGNNDAANNVVIAGQSNLNSFDIGGQVGLGFNYRIRSRTWLNVDLGYMAGVVPVIDTPTGKLRNEAYNLNVGVSFPVFGR
ncbi:MAG: hypothetical protein ACJAZY_001210 [Spirosomataceae bacterium]|jgi:hypothetical protein